MINQDELRQYHRQATMYVLQSSQSMTAAEAHEAVTGLALAKGHPKECAAISPAGVAGVLRSLQNEGIAVRGPARQNTRHGRSEPTWRLEDGLQMIQPPTAPGRRSGAAPANAAGQDPLAHLSREQLMAMILVGDELSAATARFQAEVEGIKDRAKVILAGGVLF